MTKTFRWICPECGSGKNIGARPRRNATVRYCLPCSERSGVLVERTCPVLDRKRAAGRERSKVKTAKKQERANARYMVNGTDIRTVFNRVWKIARTVQGSLPKRPPMLTVGYRAKYSGRAYWGSHRIIINRGSKRMNEQIENYIDTTKLIRTIIHEIAHFIQRDRDYYSEPHGDVFGGSLVDLETACIEKGIVDSPSSTQNLRYI